MSEVLQPSGKPTLATDLSPEWITRVRGIIARDGHAVRACLDRPTIEVQNPNRPEVWQPLNLETNTALFATTADRDQVLQQLIGRKS
jgi:hypothetical protein